MSGTLLLNMSIRNPLGIPEKGTSCTLQRTSNSVPQNQPTTAFLPLPLSVHRLLQNFCSTQGYNIPILTDKPPRAMQAALEAKSRLQGTSATHIPSSSSESPASSAADPGSASSSPVDVEPDVAAFSDDSEPAAQPDEAARDEVARDETAHDEVEPSGADVPPSAEDDEPTQPHLWSLPDSREQVCLGLIL